MSKPFVRGDELDPKKEVTLRQFEEIVANVTSARADFFKSLIDPRRDMNDECGWPETITPEMYRDAYDRNPIAARVVDVMCNEVWALAPTVYEVEDGEEQTEFEKAWDELAASLGGKSWHKQEEGNAIWEFLERADCVSGVGHYGVILLGIDDGLELDQPAAGIDKDGQPTKTRPKDRKLIYLRCFNELQAEIESLNTDRNSPRYGFPEYYNIQFNDPKDGAAQPIVGGDLTTKKVHWSRCIHLADNRRTNEVYGTPRMQQLFDNILDCKKLYGSSAEMYYKGAFPGLSLETHPNLGAAVKIDEVKHKDMMENYMNGLQRYLNLFGMQAKSLEVQVSDPTPQITVQLVCVCIFLTVPMRIFMGSERGELASSQDDSKWNKRVAKKQKTYTTPKVIVPFVDRLIMLGVLPEPEEFCAKWPDLNALTDADKADILLKRTQALGLYIDKGLEAMIAPHDFLVTEMKFTDEEATAFLDNVTKHLGDSHPDTEEEIMPGHAVAPPEPELPPPGPMTVKPGDKLVDPSSGKKIFGNPAPKKPTT